MCVCFQREQGGLGVKIVGKQVVSISMVTIARVTFERGRLVLRNCFFFFLLVCTKGGKAFGTIEKLFHCSPSKSQNYPQIASIVRDLEIRKCRIISH